MSEKINIECDYDNPIAFPRVGFVSPEDGEPISGNLGMSLRDYFAAAALQGAFINCCDFSYEWRNEITGEKQYLYSEFCLPSSESLKGWKLYQTPMHRVSRVCYQYGDAMLAARKEIKP